MYMFLGHTDNDWRGIRLMTGAPTMTPEQMEKHLIADKSSHAFVHGYEGDKAAIDALRDAGFPQSKDIWPYINMLARA